MLWDFWKCLWRIIFFKKTKSSPFGCVTQWCLKGNLEAKVAAAAPPFIIFGTVTCPSLFPELWAHTEIRWGTDSRSSWFWSTHLVRAKWLIGSTGREIQKLLGDSQKLSGILSVVWGMWRVTSEQAREREREKLHCSGALENLQGALTQSWGFCKPLGFSGHCHPLKEECRG